MKNPVYEKCTSRNVSRNINLNNSAVYYCISLTKQKNGCYDKLSAMKLFWFCLSRTLRVILVTNKLREMDYVYIYIWLFKYLATPVLFS